MVTKPYELYIRFLVTLGCDSLDKVNGYLAELNLKPVEQAEFERQYNLVHDHVPVPVSRQIENGRYEGDFLRWMKVLEVDGLWYLEKKYRTVDNSHLKLSRDIHTDPQLRVTLNALLLKGVKPSDLTQSLNLKFSYMLKAEHIELYRKFFWDCARMTRGSWREYLKLCDEREKAILFTALTESVEVVKTLLDLPSKTNVSEALQYLFTSSYQKAKQYLRLNTPEANNEARKWISQTVNLADKYEKHSSGDIEDFGKTLQLEFEYVETAFPTPDETTLADMRAKQKAEEDAASAKIDAAGSDT